MNRIITNKLGSILDLSPLQSVDGQTLVLRPKGAKGDAREVSEEVADDPIVERVRAANWVDVAPIGIVNVAASAPAPAPAVETEAPPPSAVEEPPAPAETEAPPPSAVEEPPAPAEPEAPPPSAVEEPPALPVETTVTSETPVATTPAPSSSSSKSRPRK